MRIILEDNKTSMVKDLYSKYPFPGIENLDESILPLKIGSYGDIFEIRCIGISHLPDILHYIFNGYWDKNKKMRILIAGGGTGQHTYWLCQQLKLSGYDYEIIHFELSEKAIEVAKSIIEKHDLKNVKLVRGSLLELDNFEQIETFKEPETIYDWRRWQF